MIRARRSLGVGVRARASAALAARAAAAASGRPAAFDAQRTGWVRADARLTKEAVQKGDFKFLWKAKFDNEARQLNSLTQPVLLDLADRLPRLQGAGASSAAAPIACSPSTPISRSPYWTAHLNYAAATGGQPPSSWECPGG